MVYSITTTAEQEIVLGIAAQNSNQAQQQILNDIVMQALSSLEDAQRESYLATIAANDGLQTLETLAAQPPDSKTAPPA